MSTGQRPSRARIDPRMAELHVIARAFIRAFDESVTAALELEDLAHENGYDHELGGDISSLVIDAGPPDSLLPVLEWFAVNGIRTEAESLIERLRFSETAQGRLDRNGSELVTALLHSDPEFAREMAENIDIPARAHQRLRDIADVDPSLRATAEAGVADTGIAAAIWKRVVESQVPIYLSLRSDLVDFDPEVGLEGDRLAATMSEERKAADRRLAETTSANADSVGLDRSTIPFNPHP